MNIHELKQIIQKKYEMAEKMMKSYDYPGTQKEFEYYKGERSAFLEILDILKKEE